MIFGRSEVQNMREGVTITEPVAFGVPFPAPTQPPAPAPEIDPSVRRLADTALKSPDDSITMVATYDVGVLD